MLRCEVAFNGWLLYWGNRWTSCTARFRLGLIGIDKLKLTCGNFRISDAGYRRANMRMW